MKITSLPDDIISFIFEKLPRNKRRIFNTTIVLSNAERALVKHDIIRSMLYIKLAFHIKFLFKQLQMCAFSIEDPGGPRYNGQCLHYSPFVQYGGCRFCKEHRYKHKYNKMMGIYYNCIYTYDIEQT